MSLFKVLKSQSKHIQEFNDIEVNTKHSIIISDLSFKIG